MADIRKTYAHKKQMKALREKYATGICSDYFIRTGKVKDWKEKVEIAEEVEHLKKQNEKNVKEALKNASKRKGRKLKIEDKLIFI